MNPLLWEVSTGNKLWGTREDADNNASRLAFSPDGTMIATGSLEIHLFAAVDGKKLRTIEHARRWVMALAFSRDGSMLAAADDPYVKIWDPRTGKLIRTLEGKILAGHLVFSADGKTLFADKGDEASACGTRPPARAQDCFPTYAVRFLHWRFLKTANTWLRRFGPGSRTPCTTSTPTR